MKNYLAIGLLCCLIAAPTFATIVTFDDLTDSFGAIEDGYGGMNWTQMNYIDADSLHPGSGYDNGTFSADIAGSGKITTVSAIDGEFDFQGAYLTAAWNNGLNITVEGFNGSEKLYTQTVVVDTDAPTWFQFGYSGIDTLQFTAAGGTNAGLPSFGSSRTGTGAYFAMDNFTYSTSVQVPEPCTLILCGLGALGLLKRRYTL